MRKAKTRKRKGTVFMTLGLLLIAAALFLAGYNLWDERRAETAAQQVLTQLEEAILPGESDAILEESPDVPPLVDAAETADSPVPQVPAYLLDPNMEMPTIEINGNLYIGVLDIPKLGLCLPVMSQWSYAQLKIAPCRFSGSAYSGDLVIAGHNYSGHFRTLKSLTVGDLVYFTDTAGNVFSYEVCETEVLAPTDVEKMEAGAWDLTLFTCTVGGQSRVTVRCAFQEE